MLSEAGNVSAASAPNWASAARRPGSLAWAPSPTFWLAPSFTGAVARAEGAVSSPLYQITVSDAVPGTVAVAVSKGGPATRTGGLEGEPAKKSCAATSAEAAASEVDACWPTADVKAVARLAAVAAMLAPMAKAFSGPPGETVVRAVSSTVCCVPSGKVSTRRTLSPSAGWPASARPAEAGGPAVSWRRCRSRRPQHR